MCVYIFIYLLEEINRIEWLLSHIKQQPCYPYFESNFVKYGILLSIPASHEWTQMVEMGTRTQTQQTIQMPPRNYYLLHENWVNGVVSAWWHQRLATLGTGPRPSEGPCGEVNCWIPSMVGSSGTTQCVIEGIECGTMTPATWLWHWQK